MRKKKPSPPLENQSRLTSEDIRTRLEHFHVFRSRRVRSIFTWIPASLFLLVLADWLVGSGAFSRDTFRMTAVLTAALLFLSMQVLFDRLPRTLEIIWRRDVLEARSLAADTHPFLNYLDQFEDALNSRNAWLPAAMLAVGFLFATYPFRILLQTDRFPFDLPTLLLYYFGGQLGILAPVLGFIIGLLVWRVGVIAYFIGQIGERFALKLQVNHPDGCGGLKPLGDIALNLAIIILIPSIFLAIWGFITSLTNDPSLELYITLWGGLYRQLLVVLSVLALFAFLQPLYKIHLAMLAHARQIQGELDHLGRSIETSSIALRSQASALGSQEGEEKLRSIEFMKKVYEQNSRIPTWPIAWNTLLQFVGAQVLPVLSLLGTSGPILDILRNLLASGT